MATAAVKRAPKEISPLIRSARWASLICGILYGRHMYKKYYAMEMEVQAYEKPIRERINLKKTYEQDYKVAVQMNSLAESTDIKTRIEIPKKPEF